MAKYSLKRARNVNSENGYIEFNLCVDEKDRIEIFIKDACEIELSKFCEIIGKLIKFQEDYNANQKSEHIGDSNR